MEHFETFAEHYTANADTSHTLTRWHNFLTRGTTLDDVKPIVNSLPIPPRPPTPGSGPRPGPLPPRPGPTPPPSPYTVQRLRKFLLANILGSETYFASNIYGSECLILKSSFPANLGQYKYSNGQNFQANDVQALWQLLRSLA